MRSAIDQILEEKFEYENGSLDFSCTKLELVLDKGERCEGSFVVYAAQEGFTKGYVTTTDMRMECLTEEFTGTGEEIHYCFHGETMEEGDVVKGNFCVVSNCGEYFLPFVASVRYGAPESSIGPIKNLFHFANLAKSNWAEAVNLFYSPRFISVFSGNDRHLYDCYRGLSANPGNEQNMEEFLIRINKKQKVNFIAKDREIALEIAEGVADGSVTETELEILRNGWGYTALQVECEGDFVFTEKEFLTDDDFLGNSCRIPVFIDPTVCRTGKNFGRIYIYNSYVSIEIPVTVKYGKDSVYRRIELEQKHRTIRLMDYYQAFRMKKIGTGMWLKETGKLVEEMIARDEKDIAARLFQAQLLVSEERYNEAGWILDHVVELLERDEDNDTLWAYYLYLTTLVRREEDYVNDIASQVEHIFRRDRANWRIAWLLLYLSEEYNKTAITKWEFLEKQFVYGCYSPVLYIEAVNLLAANPTLLRKLDEYTLQVLYYGVRQDAFGPDVIEQLLYLMGRNREYSPLLLKLFEKIYRKNNDTRVLQEICTLLIRGNLVGPAYFEWYRAGVDAQLRITNLYEYYMMSMDPGTTDEIPKVALMYFSYQNNLDYARSAFLYDYVLKHREELGDIYETYLPKIEYFMLDQIKKGHINRHLAGIYQELLTPAMVNEKIAEPLAKLLFAHQIRVEDLRLKKVIVYQPGNLQEHEYPIRDGGVWVPLYGEDSTILFEDAYGNRFVQNAEYSLEKLMIPGKYLRALAMYVKNSPELDLFLQENGREGESLVGEGMERALRLADDEQVEPEIRRRLYLRILQHYYDADDMETVDTFLQSMPVEMFTLEERARIVKYMVLRERYDMAWDWVREFGPWFVDQKTLLKIVGARIENEEFRRDVFVEEVAYYLFRLGKFDSRVIGYLVDCAQGDTKELRNLWKAARSFDINCRALSEKILCRMMFSGAYVGERMDIFAYYLTMGADERVKKAFLTYCSYEHFVKEKLPDETIFREIAGLYQKGEEIPKVCKLAFLKYYAENADAVTQEILPILGSFLENMHAERIHLNFFREFEKMELPQKDLLREMTDKTIIEYHAGPGAKVRIHYVVMHEDGEDSEYRVEPMREVYGGLCFKEFILFFGESLQYYIMEECDGQEQLTESGNLPKSDINGNREDSRFEMINDILVSKTLQEFDTLDSLLDEYYRREYFNENLFTLM